MASPYDPLNWYWVVAGSATHVYSSASQSYVVIADATYVAWLAAEGGNTPTPVSTEALLFTILNPETPSAIERDLSETTIDPTDGGPWTFTVVAGKFFPVGGTLFIRPFADLSIVVIGEVKAYSSTSLTVSLRATNATVSQTYDLWTIALLDSPPADLPILSIVGLDWSADYATRILTVNAGSVMDSTGAALLTLEEAVTKDLALDWSAGDAGGAMVRVQLGGTVNASTTTIAGSGTAFLTDFATTIELSDYTASGGGSNYASCISLTGAGASGDSVSTITNNTSMFVSPALGGSAGASYMRGALDSRWSASPVFSMFVLVVRKDSDGTTDIALSSTRPSGAPDLPSGYTYYRCIGVLVIHYGLGEYIYDKHLYSSSYPFAFETANYVLHTEFGNGFSPSSNAKLLASSTSEAVVVGTNIEIQRAALTGDVTASANSNTTTIANDAVTNAKLANMAAATFKMRAAGAGTGDPIDGTATQARTALGVREVLSANRTYYVRTDGSDSNTGLTNSSGGAFLTIQKAVSTIATLDCGGFVITISVGAGTFTAGAAFTLPLVGCAGVTISGAGSTSTFVNATSAQGFAVYVPLALTVSGMDVTTTTAGSGLRSDGPGSKIIIGSDMIFGACADATIMAFNNANVVGFSNFTINGSSGRWLHSELGGIIELAGQTITFSGTPAWSTAGIYFTGGAAVSMFSVTLSGSATGSRYAGSLNATVNSFSAGSASTYFPGNANGTTASGAQQA